MRTYKILIHGVLALAIVLLSLTSSARVVTQNEAASAAENWVQVVIESHGTWGLGESASVLTLAPFVVNGRTVGYVADISPDGFIILNAMKELPPIQGYATKGHFDPDCPEGATDIFRQTMSQSTDYLRQLADSAGKDAETDVVMPSSNPDSWHSLLHAASTLSKDFSSASGRDDYIEGRVMLECVWSQIPPYNDDCPDADCEHCEIIGDCEDYPDNEFYNQNADAGCAAIAMSQVMRYWGWPPASLTPYGCEYNWRRMVDRISWAYLPGPNFYAYEDGLPIGVATASQVNAIAELVSTAGESIGTVYSCDGSGALGPVVPDALHQYFRYRDSPELHQRVGYSDDDWWDLITYHMDRNRPVIYSHIGHVFVVDGWKVVAATRFIHVNYGHGPGATCDGHAANYWWGITGEICGHGSAEHQAIVNIRPAQSLGSSISGDYEKDPNFGHRYFDRDATGDTAWFEAGQYLHFHKGGEVKCTGGTGESIRFEGTGTTIGTTSLFTRGDPTVGILLKQGGEIHLKNGGAIGFF